MIHWKSQTRVKPPIPRSGIASVPPACRSQEDGERDRRRGGGGGWWGPRRGGGGDDLYDVNIIIYKLPERLTLLLILYFLLPVRVRSPLDSAIIPLFLFSRKDEHAIIKDTKLKHNVSILLNELFPYQEM